MQPTPGSNNETSTALDNFFKEVYPKNTALQWSLVSSPDVENILWGYRDVRGNRMNGKDNEISTYADFLPNFDSVSHTITNRIYYAADIVT